MSAFETPVGGSTPFVRPTSYKVQVWIYRHPADPGSRQEELEVLLLRTNQKRGDFWQPVTGGVERGESVEVAALREASEETGMKYQINELQPLGDFTFESRFGESVHEFCFALHANRFSEVIQLDPREHQEFRWVSPNVALGMLRYPSNAVMLKNLLRLVAEGADSHAK